MVEVEEIFNYSELLKQVKARVLTAQRKAVYAVNVELLRLYWDVGKLLRESQQKVGWGEKAIEKLSKDMRNEYPEVKGFSARNCRNMSQFYNEYPDGIESSILPGNSTVLPINRLTWTHNITLIRKVKDWELRYWYMVECIRNGWKNDVLEEMINNKVHEHQGILPNNFNHTLPELQADQVRTIFKDPYLLDMLTLSDGYDERDIELGMVRHIEKCLLELGAGFAFVGRQYHLELEGTDYYIDLLFYYIPLNSYIVVELKNGPFVPEYAGKMNFYCRLVDEQLKRENNGPTIGLILCKTKKRLTAEYALNRMEQPIGISVFKVPACLPADIASRLPSIEDIEEQLSEGLDEVGKED